MFGDQNCFTNSFQSIQNSIAAVSNRLSTLSSSLISSNNLPIYLQNYTFSSGGVLGSTYFTIVGGLPTNVTLDRTWNLVMAGTCPANTMMITFTYDFSNVVSSYNVTIKGTLAGTLTFNGMVYDASQYFMTPTLVNNVLTLNLDMSSMSMDPTNSSPIDISYNLYLADSVNNRIY
jgi:hypothetical protein